MATPKRKIVLADVADYCRAQGYTLRDAKYRSHYWLDTGASPKASTSTVFMCSCGWASERHGCPLHG